MHEREIEEEKKRTKILTLLPQHPLLIRLGIYLEANECSRFFASTIIVRFAREKFPIFLGFSVSELGYVWKRNIRLPHKFCLLEYSF